MAVSRLRLPTPEEMADMHRQRRTGVLKDVESRGVIFEAEVPVLHARLRAKRTSAEHSLRQKASHLQYLKNLERISDRTATNVEECPVCRGELGQSWSVLTCGHCFCWSCVRALMQMRTVNEQGHRSRLRCPVCREACPRASIAFVVANSGNRNVFGSDEEEVECTKICGEYSTKIEAIVRRVLKINRRDQQARTLIFSSWPEALKIVAGALATNKIEYASLLNAHGVGIQRELFKFKGADSKTRVLLMPLHAGAKGLNITEANHVIFVEPVLKKADEQQAIGRVYRMGQQRQTFVHRFYIQGTVEERILSVSSKAVVQTSRAQTHAEDVDAAWTVGQLRDLCGLDEFGM